jgi:hypothetical protein
MRNAMWAALTAGAILAGSGAAWASDTVRLGGPAAQASVQGGTDTELVRWRHYHRHGHWGGGYYSAGYYARPYYSASYYATPYYYPSYSYAYPNYSYYYPTYSYYTPAYYPAHYYRPSYYSHRPAHYHRIAGETVPAETAQGNTAFQTPFTLQYTPTPNGDGSFPYDGDPRIVVPMPNRGAPTPGGLPADGKLVSLPSEVGGGVFPVGLPSLQRTTSPAAPRVTYPAYGDEPIIPAPRKLTR